MELIVFLEFIGMQNLILKLSAYVAAIINASMENKDLSVQELEELVKSI